MGVYDCVWVCSQAVSCTENAPCILLVCIVVLCCRWVLVGMDIYTVMHIFRNAMHLQCPHPITCTFSFYLKIVAGLLNYCYLFTIEMMYFSSSCIPIPSCLTLFHVLDSFFFPHTSCIYFFFYFNNAMKNANK